MTPDEERRVRNVQRAYNVWRVTETLRRFVPDAILSDRELVNMAVEDWRDSLQQPLIDPNE